MSADRRAYARSRIGHELIGNEMFAAELATRPVERKRAVESVRVLFECHHVVCGRDEFHELSRDVC